MSGVLWGFANKDQRRPRPLLGIILAVLPALWAFFMTSGGPVGAGLNLMFGFAASGIDAAFWPLAFIAPRGG